MEYTEINKTTETNEIKNLNKQMNRNKHKQIKSTEIN